MTFVCDVQRIGCFHPPPRGRCLRAAPSPRAMAAWACVTRSAAVVPYPWRSNGPSRSQCARQQAGKASSFGQIGQQPTAATHRARRPARGSPRDTRRIQSCTAAIMVLECPCHATLRTPRPAQMRRPTEVFNSRQIKSVSAWMGGKAPSSMARSIWPNQQTNTTCANVGMAATFGNYHICPCGSLTIRPERWSAWPMRAKVDPRGVHNWAYSPSGAALPFKAWWRKPQPIEDTTRDNGFWGTETNGQHKLPATVKDTAALIPPQGRT